MDNNPLERDDRVVLFGKALTLDGEHFHKSDAAAPLISLGYFDSLRIHQLERGDHPKDWLRTVRSHSIALARKLDAQTYHHPLYIFKYAAAADLKTFWESPRRFLSVSLVHFSDAQRQSREEPFRGVEADIKAATTGGAVQAMCYQSIDLSDMVVIWRSGSLTGVLEQLQALYQHRYVGNMRTICAFSPAPEDLRAEEGTQVDREIPYVSFRFCVNNAGAVGEFTRLLRERCPWWPEEGGYFTTGSEDLNVVFSQLLESRLLNAISLWFSDPAINRAFQAAFYESSTHLGVEVKKTPFRAKDGKEPPAGGNSEETSHALAAKCGDLLDSFQALQKKYQDSLPPEEREATVNVSWCKIVCDQLNALADMSRIPVLDGFCYIILDGARTFCRLLKKHLRDGQALSDESLGRIQRFARGWGVLTNQAIRVDGQFIQTPGFSPALYDIPVELQEFYIGFTWRCMELMQKVDGAEDQYHYALFLLPKLCRRTKVEDVFQDPAPCHRLLYVDVPLDLLYDPMQILPQLCHEVSHYCGETIRCRPERAKCVLMACASLLAGHLGWVSAQTIREIYHTLDQEIDLSGGAYMDELIRKLEDFLMILPQKVSVLKRWWQTRLADGPEDGGLPFKNALADDSNLQKVIKHMKTVVVFFQEGYADVSMIYLLDLSWEEYLSLYQQELRWLTRQEDKEERRAIYAEFVQRAALVLYSTGRRPPQPESAAPRAVEARFAAHVAELYQALKEERKGNAAVTPGESAGRPGVYQYYLPLDTLKSVCEYLCRCYRTMQKELGERNEIQSTFAKIAREDGIGSAEYQDILFRYERRLLDGNGADPT